MPTCLHWDPLVHTLLDRISVIVVQTLFTDAGLHFATLAFCPKDVQRFMSLFLFAIPMRWTWDAWVPSGKAIRVFALHPTLLGDHITRSLGQQRNNCPWSSNIDNFHAARLGALEKVSSPSSANPRSTSSTSPWPSCRIIHATIDRIWMWREGHAKDPGQRRRAMSCRWR